MLSKEKTNRILCYAGLILIAALSFRYYAPCNFYHYSSDMSIHTLMAKDFQLPRDFFYWGQYRLGSLLPMMAFLLGKILPIHELYLCSIIDYLFLLSGFLVISTQIKSYALKLALCALIFFPPGEYHALLQIGHPYSSQLFAGSLFVYFLALLRKYLLTHADLKWAQLPVALLLSLAASIFFVAGIWASEFNAVLILFPLVYVILEKQLRDMLISGLMNIRVIVFVLLSLSFLLGLSYWYFEIKRLYFFDPEYQKFLIDNVPDLQKNLGFFIKKLQVSFTFSDTENVANLFNWFLFLLTSTLVSVRIIKGKVASSKKKMLINSLLIICLVSCLLLFLSAWNLRSEFRTRYFTPVYLVFGCFLLLLLDGEFYRGWFRLTASACFILLGLAYCYQIVWSRPHPTPFERFGEFRDLPKGTFISGYWDVYRICSVAIDNLQPLPLDHEQVRNYEWKEIPLSETNIYFEESPDIIPGGTKDTVSQYGILFKYSGTRYNCNGNNILLYHKIPPNNPVK